MRKRLDNPIALKISHLLFERPENLGIKKRFKMNVKIFISFPPNTCDMHIYM